MHDVITHHHSIHLLIIITVAHTMNRYIMHAIVVRMIYVSWHAIYEYTWNHHWRFLNSSLDFSCETWQISQRYLTHVPSGCPASSHTFSSFVILPFLSWTVDTPWLLPWHRDAHRLCILFYYATNWVVYAVLIRPLIYNYFVSTLTLNWTSILLLQHSIPTSPLSWCLCIIVSKSRCQYGY